jgi:hypothetical protein
MSNGFSVREVSLLDRLEKARNDAGKSNQQYLSAKRENAELKEALKRLSD